MLLHPSVHVSVSDNFVEARRLQQVYVPLMNWEECREILGGYGFTDNMFCAGEPYEGKDACDVSHDNIWILVRCLGAISISITPIYE